MLYLSLGVVLKGPEIIPFEPDPGNAGEGKQARHLDLSPDKNSFVQGENP